MTSRLLGFILWTSPKGQKNTMEVKSHPVVSQNSVSDDTLFHYIAEMLNDVESQEDFEITIVTRIRLIWAASSITLMTSDMVKVVFESINFCKRTKFIDSVDEFYEFRVDGKILPAWIILHSPSDDESKAKTRHLILQTYLDELPLTTAIRDELYLACAEKGFNNYFNRIRLASLKQFQARPEAHEKIGHGLRLPADPAETLKVVHTAHGFKLDWFIPDMLQRLQSGFAIGREFVAKGRVWGLYIRNQRDQLGPCWDMVLCTLNPSQNVEGDVLASFFISPYKEIKILGQGLTTGFVLYSDHVETLDPPIEGDMPLAQNLWSFSGPTVDICHRYINKDGSCHLMFDVKILLPVTVEFHRKKVE